MLVSTSYKDCGHTDNAYKPGHLNVQDRRQEVWLERERAKLNAEEQEAIDELQVIAVLLKVGADRIIITSIHVFVWKWPLWIHQCTSARMIAWH